MPSINKKIQTILEISLKEKTLRKIIFSSSLQGEIKKIILKPLISKKGYFIQGEEFRGNQAFHKNLDIDSVEKYILENSLNFKNLNIFTADYEISIVGDHKKSVEKIVKIETQVEIKSHNREKNYIIPEGEKIEFLEDLGIMDGEGKVLKNSYSKFRQINRYLEIIKDVIDELQRKKLIENDIKLVDFGSGKSYLTFVLYYYLKVIRKLDVTVIGLDLKKDVMEHCSKLAEKYGFANLKFIYGDIKDFEELKDAHMVFSLHACNNATDYAILKGLELNAKAILAVPCCHKEFNQKISKAKNSRLQKELVFMGKHGILMEKFAALATEGFRSDALEICGYDSSVMEFIDTEHTPKNLLIKAIAGKNNLKAAEQAKVNCENFMEYSGIKLVIYDLLKPYFIV